ncbi:GntR family transcriptional regulator [Xanthobacter sp. KR7-65]|uniref:GntR family transcriptional regulator n=1 Tax=Xanthobacter sp. KR7-65 TaxID=3156612 RepID=UPI0032B46F1C
MAANGADLRRKLASRGETVRAVPASARIHAALRDDIVAMVLAPGMPLQEKQIALSCGVSRTPVREAILKLADERLVDIFPQYGTFVSRISVQAVRDAMIIRNALERTSVREAAARVAAVPEKARRALVAPLVALVRQQRATHRAGELAAFHAADEGFHQIIADLAGHPNLWRVIRQEKAHVDRCRLLTLPSPQRRASVIAEHQAVADAIAAGDADAAEAAMAAHLGRVIPSVEDLCRAHPDYFEAELAPAEAANAR